jgi:hypothetical protein
LSEFSISVALSELVLNDTVEVLLGDGEFDDMKRTITWRLPLLSKGESFMVSARAKVADAPKGVEGKKILSFPVMLRCSSQDQIGTAQFQAIEASGYPATVTSLSQSQSFRMIHRLN